jgi:large subunit ribosomal protein L31
MKPDIHPKYYPDAHIVCACGNVFVVGATVPEMTTEVCSNCHPFFTGEQRIVDTAGQVERFMRRLEVGAQQRVVERERAEQRLEHEREAKRRRRGLSPVRPRATKVAQPADDTAATPAESASSDEA